MFGLSSYRCPTSPAEEIDLAGIVLTHHRLVPADLEAAARKRRADIDDLLRELQPVIRPSMWLRYDVLQAIATATALYRGDTGDANNPDIVVRWMIDYLMEYVIEVQGVCALGQYTANPEAARKAGLPQAYALIAAAWPELAPYCPTYDWQEIRSLIYDFREPVAN